MQQRTLVHTALLFACSVSWHTLRAQALVSTVAGDGTAGVLDGPAAQARFNLPYGVSADAQGNIYVADSNNHLIRKITPVGVVSTVAGNGGRGYVDHSNPLFAQFARPQGIVADPHGNLFIADTGNGSVRKISPTGQVSTVAGSGFQGFQDGAGSIARFFSPAGIAVAPDKGLYISDTGNYRVRSIDSLGQVSTLAGSIRGYVDGPAAVAQFLEPTGIVRDGGGNLLVADRAAHAIRRISPAGAVSTLAGTGTAGYLDGPAATAQFTSPAGLALDAAGNLYVTERDAHRIRRISPDGVVSTVAGTGLPAGFQDGPAITARFNGPFGACYDVATQSLVLADIGNHRIRRVSSLPLAAWPSQAPRRSFQLYPNPAQATATVSYQLARSGPVELTLFDALGREVLRQTRPISTAQLLFTWVVETATLPAGVYVCQLVADGQILTQRLAVAP